jgi:hypothetical protein
LQRLPLADRNLDFTLELFQQHTEVGHLLGDDAEEGGEGSDAEEGGEGGKMEIRLLVDDILHCKPHASGSEGEHAHPDLERRRSSHNIDADVPTELVGVPHIRRRGSSQGAGSLSSVGAGVGIGATGFLAHGAGLDVSAPRSPSTPPFRPQGGSDGEAPNGDFKLKYERRPLFEEIRAMKLRGNPTLVVLVAVLWTARLAVESGLLDTEGGSLARFVHQLVVYGHFLIDAVMVGAVYFLLPS